MNYNILYWDMGDAYIVELADKKTVLVNVETEYTEEGSLAKLAQFGQWTEVFDEPGAEVRTKIEEMLGMFIG